MGSWSYELLMISPPILSTCATEVALSNTLCGVFVQATKESYVYWLIFGKTEKLILVILSLLTFIMVSPAFLGGSIYRWYTPVISSSICNVLSSLLRDTYIDNEMIPQELYVARFSAFFTLLMTWNKLLHGQFFLLVIIIIYYIYPQTDYCRSTLFWLFLPISFIVFFQYRWWRQSSLLNKLSHSFCSYSHYLLLQTNLLRVMAIKFPCGICLKPVANNHQAIKCDKCNLWIHIKGNKINRQTDTYLQTGTSYWYCMTCTKEFLPFSDTNDEELIQTTIGKRIKFAHINNVPQSVKENFIHKITSETNTSKYFTMSDLQPLSYNKKLILHCSIWI